jgi:hypothetical protein
MKVMKAFNFQFLIFSAVATSFAWPGSAHAINKEVTATGTASLSLASSSGLLIEVNKLLDAKVDSAVIVAYVQNSRASFDLTATEIIALKDRGASSDVLKALLEHQSRPLARAPQVANPVPAPAVAATPAYAYSPEPAYPAYGYDAYPAYAYGASYPSYAYYDYGWPSSYIGSYAPYCYSGWYGRGCYPRYSAGCYGFPYAFNRFGGLRASFGNHFGGSHFGSFGVHSGGFHTSGSFTVSGGHGFGGSHVSGGFHGGGGSGGHSGGHR